MIEAEEKRVEMEKNAAKEAYAKAYEAAAEAERQRNQYGEYEQPIWQVQEAEQKRRQQEEAERKE